MRKPASSYQPNLVLICVGALMLASCRANPEPVPQDLDVQGAGEGEGLHPLHVEESMLASHLFHDEQYLIANGNGSRGPYGKVAVIIDLAQGDDYFNAGKPVAFVHIGPNGSMLPAPFDRRGYQCVFLRRNGDAWAAAFMAISVQSDTAARNACLKATMPSSANATVFRRIEMPSPTSEPPSPVARWDWDAQNTRQYLGIRCGNGWCEIGATGSTSSGGNHLKGRYDEQHVVLPTSNAYSVHLRIERTAETIDIAWKHMATIIVGARALDTRVSNGSLVHRELRPAIDSLAHSWKLQSALLAIESPTINVLYCARLHDPADTSKGWVKYVPVSGSASCNTQQDSLELVREPKPRVPREGIRPEMRFLQPTGIPNTARWGPGVGQQGGATVQGWVECDGCCKPKRV
jgi:hypothetical protein